MSFFAYGETQVVHGSVIGVPFVRARVLNGLFFRGIFPCSGPVEHCCARIFVRSVVWLPRPFVLCIFPSLSLHAVLPLIITRCSVTFTTGFYSFG